MKEVLFKDLEEGQRFSYGKSTYIKSRFGHCDGALYGKRFTNWKSIPDNKKVMVESDGGIKPIT